jgi:hypothetical protein
VDELHCELSCSFRYFCHSFQTLFVYLLITLFSFSFSLSHFLPPASSFSFPSSLSSSPLFSFFPLPPSLFLIHFFSLPFFPPSSRFLPSFLPLFSFFPLPASSSSLLYTIDHLLQCVATGTSSVIKFLNVDLGYGDKSFFLDDGEFFFTFRFAFLPL